MNLPQNVSDLIYAQNSFDSKSYAACFAEDATVIDEGNTYHSRAAILKWIEKANQQYNATMEPLSYNDTEMVLEAKIAGNFPGSPAILRYQLQFSDSLIQSLQIV